MKLWCIRYTDFGIALVEGIDRNRESQVSAFVRRHGDHSTQHVAFGVDNIDDFVGHLQQFGLRLRGEILVRRDGFGMVKQVFTKGFTKGDPATTMFFEFVERPKQLGAAAEVTFAQTTGKGFYQQIEDARASADDEAMIDFSAMPFLPQQPSRNDPQNSPPPRRQSRSRLVAVRLKDPRIAHDSRRVARKFG